MNQKEKLILTQLHEIEEQLIQMNGLVKALQQLQTNDSATICMINALQQQINTIQKSFYQHWEIVIDKERDAQEWLNASKSQY